MLNSNGKIFILERDSISAEDVLDVDSLKWNYLEGDGDFRSDEIRKLRDEADIIITNPPFSLFREFIKWIFEANKKFLVIGNINAITYKEIFPLIKDNKAWLGNGMGRWISGFIVPKNYELYGTEARIEPDGTRIIATNNCLWLTNIEHGKRHEKLSLMTAANNIKFNKKLKGKDYLSYENYNAIEVPYTDAIPSDYKGIMGVPITFLDKYNPEQFEILGMCENEDLYKLKTKIYTTEECKAAYFNKFNKKGTYDLNASGVILLNGLLEKVYQRILIKAK